MSNSTEIFGLIKPDIAVINDNMDLIDKVVGDLAIIKTAEGLGNAISLALPSVTAYIDQYMLTFIAGEANDGAATSININGLGEKPLYKPNTTAAPNLIAGKAYTVWYDAAESCFFIKASAEGTAVAENVLAGMTFSNDNDTGLQGAMPSNGPAVPETMNLTEQDQEYTIAAGFHSGLRKIKAVITGLAADVIKAGVTVGGIAGTFTNDATATAATMLQGVTAWVKGVLVTGSIPSKAAADYYPSQATQVIGAGQYLEGDQTINTVTFDAAKVLEDTNIAGKQGTMTDNGPAVAETVDLTAQDQEYMIVAGFHSGLRKIRAVITGLAADVIKAGVTVGGIAGTFTNDATATAATMLQGVTAWVKGVLVTGSIPSKAAAAYNPSQATQVIEAGQYLEGDQTINPVTFDAAKVLEDTNIAGKQGTMANNGPAVAGTVNLTSQNQEYAIAAGFHSGLRKIKAVITGLVANVIKAGVTVGGIAGTFTNDATATAATMLQGVSAWVKGVLVEGGIPSKAATTITPSTTQQSIAAGQYLAGNQIIDTLGGNAPQSAVRSDYTFSSDAVGRAKAGSMPVNGSQTATVEISGSAKPTKVIPAGYTPGGTITAQLAAGLAPVIKAGEIVGGVTGTYSYSQVPTGSFDGDNIDSINPDTRMVYCSFNDNVRHRYNYEGTLLWSYQWGGGSYTGHVSCGFTDSVNGITAFTYDNTASGTQHIYRYNEAITVLNHFEQQTAYLHEMLDVIGFGYPGGFLTTRFNESAYKIGLRNWSGTLIAYLTDYVTSSIWYRNGSDYAQKCNAQGYPYIGSGTSLWVWGETSFRTLPITNEINEYFVEV